MLEPYAYRAAACCICALKRHSKEDCLGGGFCRDHLLNGLSSLSSAPRKIASGEVPVEWSRACMACAIQQSSIVMATAFFCCLNQCACTPMFQCHDRENCFEVAPCLSARLTTELKCMLYAASVGALLAQRRLCSMQHLLVRYNLVSRNITALQRLISKPKKWTIWEMQMVLFWKYLGRCNGETRWIANRLDSINV